MSRVHEPTTGDTVRVLCKACDELDLSVPYRHLSSRSVLVETLRRHRADLIDSLNGPDVAPTAAMLRIRTLTRQEIQVCERALRAAGVDYEEEEDE